MSTKKCIIEKKDLVNVLEPFLYEKLQDKQFKISTVSSRNLLTWNRFDIAFKLTYLDLKTKYSKLANEVYTQDIKAQTFGKFKEFGQEHKNSFSKYIESFDSTFLSIQKNGFDCNQTLLPLAKDASILNGAHRLSSAIYLDKDVDCVTIDAEHLVADYQYFFQREVPIRILDLVANKFIEYANDVYLAFLWPSGKGNKDEANSKFSNVVYKKKLNLNSIGARNLLTELYMHMDWAGTEENGFSGINGKLVECFPNFEYVQVIAFQADCIEDVREIKENVRKIYNIGYSSIHITDTKEEALRISKLIFNDNGLHYLNHAARYKFLDLYSQLDEFKVFIALNEVDKEDVLIDASTTLNLYGIRKNEDIDYLVNNDISISEGYTQYEPSDEKLKYHQIDKHNIIYNPDFHFEYYGIKFISFNQLYKMKLNRNEPKDKHDCKVMKAHIDNNMFNKIKTKLVQKLFYLKIVTRRKSIITLIHILKKTGLYAPLRKIYHQYKGL